MSIERRQDLSCGWEPAMAGAIAWQPLSWSTRGIATTVCPGYSTSLPMVEEVVGAYVHWKQRTLTDLLGEPPTDVALYLLAILEAGVNEHQADKLEAARKARG